MHFYFSPTTASRWISSISRLRTTENSMQHHLEVSGQNDPFSCRLIFVYIIWYRQSGMIVFINSILERCCILVLMILTDPRKGIWTVLSVRIHAMKIDPRANPVHLVVSLQSQNDMIYTSNGFIQNRNNYLTILILSPLFCSNTRKDWYWIIAKIWGFSI